jgi:hypothetical protein
MRRSRAVNRKLMSLCVESRRLPEAARHLRIYEVDHSATQLFKLRRLETVGIARPPAVRLVHDLSDTAIAARYDPQGCNGLRTSRHSRIARALVRFSVVSRARPLSANGGPSTRASPNVR